MEGKLGDKPRQVIAAAVGALGGNGGVDAALEHADGAAAGVATELIDGHAAYRIHEVVIWVYRVRGADAKTWTRSGFAGTGEGKPPVHRLDEESCKLRCK